VERSRERPARTARAMDGPVGRGASDDATPATHGNQRITRAEILDVAVRMFSESGYQGANLGDVAKELGVTRQALYYYFEKKDDILVALFAEVFDELERTVDLADGRTPGSQFRQMLRAHLRVVSKYPAHINVVLTEQEMLPAEMRHEMHARRWTYQKRFMRAYDAAVSSGECVDVGRDFAVSILLSAANMSSRWLERVTMNPEAVADMIERFVAGGYLAPSLPEAPPAGGGAAAPT